MNITDLGTRGASLDKIERGNWYEEPKWLLNKIDWPDQPVLKSTSQVNEETKKVTDVIAYTSKRKPDEWDNLLDRKSYWKTLRISSWILRFINNCKAKAKNEKGTAVPLQTEEILRARNYWIVKVQKDIPEILEKPGFKLEKDPETGILKCAGRVQEYKPIYLENGVFTQKLVQCVHQKIGHLGVASTMATLKEEWYMIHMRAQVKKQIRQCNIFKVFSTKPFRGNITAPLPKFRTDVSRPFQHSGVDFCGPVVYRENKEEAKAYVIIFTCAAMRAVHLESTKSQLADEFQAKLNAFITRRTRPETLISDYGGAFKATADWIRNLRRSGRLHDYFVQQEIIWKFNVSKAAWWGVIYERLIKDIKGSSTKPWVELTLVLLNSKLLS